MKKNMLFALIASAALLMVSAGSVAEAARWNSGYSRGSINYRHNGFRGNYRGNYRGYSQPNYRNNYTPYRSWNRYGNTYNNPYYNQYYYPNYYGNGAYIGSGRAGVYFRF